MVRRFTASLSMRLRRRARKLTSAYLVVAVVGLTWFGFSRAYPEGTKDHVAFVLLSAAFGAIAGASELVSRYRDEPIQAVSSPAGVLYVGMNATVSALVYGVLIRYANEIIPNLQDQLLTSVVAGFSAMAVLRLKFFSVRTAQGEDLAVGPDAVVQTFLDAADRGVDRYRAKRRLELVFDRAIEIEAPGDSRDFIQVSLAALQNLSDSELSELTEVMNDIWNTPYSDALKFQALCYGILSVTGDTYFESMIDRLRDSNRDDLRRPMPPEGEPAAGGESAPPEPPAPQSEGDV